jgi:hypothetical protein
MTVRQLDYYTIQWLETSFAYVVSFSGGLTEGCISPGNFFDQAFSEYVILGANFTDREGTKWRCVDDGSAVLISAMLDRIARKPECRPRVTRIALNHSIGSRPHWSIGSVIRASI